MKNGRSMTTARGHRRACDPWSRQADACWMERPEGCSGVEDGQHRGCPSLREGRSFRRCTVSRPDRCLGAPRLPPWPRFKPIAPESASFPFRVSPENLIRNPQGLRRHGRRVPGLPRLGLLPRPAGLGDARGALRRETALSRAFDQRPQAAQRRDADGTGRQDARPFVEHLLVKWIVQYRNQSRRAFAFLGQEILGEIQPRRSTTTGPNFRLCAGWSW